MSVEDNDTERKTSVTLPNEIWKMAKLKAIGTNVTLSAVICRALSEYLSDNTD